MPKQEVLTEEFADWIYQECGSQLPDGTKLADLHVPVDEEATPASWASLLEKLTNIQKNVVTNALGAALRGYRGRWGKEQGGIKTLGALRRGLPRDIVGLGPKRLAFLRRAFGTASGTADAHAPGGQPKTVGQYLDALLAEEDLDPKGQAMLKKLLLPQARLFARLMKQSSDEGD